MKITKVIIVLVITLFCVMPVVSIYAEKAISLEVDGVVIRSEVSPTIIDGRTMVPVRDIFEACGADVVWEPTTKKITGSKDGKVVVMQVGSNKVYINSGVTAMDSMPVIVNGRTLAPARYVASSFGGTTEWDALNKIVIIKGVTSPTVETTTEATTTTTEATTTTETTTEIMTTTAVVVNNDVSDEIVKAVRNELEHSLGTYSLGSYETAGRFKSGNMNGIIQGWENLAKTELDKNYVASAKNLYYTINSFYRGLDSIYLNTEYPKRIANFSDTMRSYKIDGNTIINKFFNTRNIDEINAVISELSAFSSKMATDIQRQYENS